MDIERKIVKTGNVDAIEGDNIKQELQNAMSENEKAKKLVDYFVLGLFMVVIMYTVI